MAVLTTRDGAVLIGDWAQLRAVETGGACGMLGRHRQVWPELTDVRRFANEWEKTASLALRHGRTQVIDTYLDPVSYTHLTLPTLYPV